MEVKTVTNKSKNTYHCCFQSSGWIFSMSISSMSFSNTSRHYAVLGNFDFLSFLSTTKIPWCVRYVKTVTWQLIWQGTSPRGRLLYPYKIFWYPYDDESSRNYHTVWWWSVSHSSFFVYLSEWWQVVQTRTMLRWMMINRQEHIKLDNDKSSRHVVAYDAA